MNLSQIPYLLENIKKTNFGISIPDLRKLARKIANENWHDFLDNKNFENFESKLLYAFVIGYVKTDIYTLLQYFKDFIPYVDDWAINDSLCQNFKVARHYPEIVWKFLDELKETNQEFTSRIVSVMLLSHYLNDTYINCVIQTIDILNTDKYYARMGVAWAIATIMGKYPDKCMSYLKSENCHLNKKTYNKALQKIQESFRVSYEIKLKLKTMRK